MDYFDKKCRRLSLL